MSTNLSSDASASGAVDQLYAVLLGLRDDALLLPNAGIVEVIARDGLEALQGTPRWFAGVIDWQGIELPVIQFEQLAGEAESTSTRRNRIAVLNCIGRDLPGSHFGVLCEGYPHLITLNRAALRSAPSRDSDRNGFVLARVRVASTEAAIPNLAGIEAELLRLLETPPA